VGATLYSIGHGRLPAEEFVLHLSRFGIGLLADVRRYPSSRRHPQFNAARLAESLASASIEYRQLGDALGGYRETSYEDYARTGSFQSGLESLEELSRGRSAVAFMCAEKLPWKCHRRFIAQALRERGWDVRHIVEGGLLLPEQASE
jgi:uncharacterized protein (DUF488 family)